MSKDFERAWLAKFSRCLDEIGGEEIRKEIMEGSEELSMNSSRKDVIAWSKKAMEKLDSLVDEQKRIAIMTGCACQYPVSELDAAKKVYEETKDIDKVHHLLQEKFIQFLKTIELDDHLIEDIINRGWGLAGTKKGNTITATKIPKSGHLIQYMREKDPEKKRALYCHCPRVNNAVESGTKISSTYCYCGAGFYKSIWEYILQQPVTVEVLQSVLQGDEVCTIAIHLSPDNSSDAQFTEVILRNR
ncbi:MAG: hypothetical protein HXS46_06135 [Theionarchaea archaeon]|nr:hypothetical protein [Theionarchaea archaeon]